MQPEKVDEMLKNFKSNLGRCAHLRVMIGELERRYEKAHNEGVEELLGSNGENDGMPHGSSIGNPTERAGLLLASGYVSETMRYIRLEIWGLQAEYDDRIATVDYVRAWLKGLTSKEVWMIGQQIFDGLCYREINHNYREKYGESCSKDLLRRLRKDALAKIYEMAA